ncbi:hypothetical protein ACIQCF_26165 [Streptomyces sp. NPDC088353]|uniref:hypothetical protein n=1 Tax=unclassified Streptomyces TaxID=2593676 RepID=UPI00368EF6CE
MTTPVPSISEPDPSTAMCRGDQVGPCTTCHRKTHRYGSGGCPLCSWCAAARGVTISRGPAS